MRSYSSLIYTQRILSVFLIFCYTVPCNVNKFQPRLCVLFSMWCLIYFLSNRLTIEGAFGLAIRVELKAICDYWSQCVALKTEWNTACSI